MIGAGRPSRAALLLGAALLLALAAAPPAGAARYDADVEAAQRALAGRGLDPGPADGLMGRRTRAALRAFQRGAGLPVTGRLDAETRRALLGAPAPPAEAGPSAGAGAGAPGVPAPAAGTAASGRPTTAPAPPPPATAPAPPPAPAPAAPPAPPPATPRPLSLAGLSYERLGWAPPDTGEAVLARHRRTGGSPVRGRDEPMLIVSGPDRVYVLRAGSRIPGFDCAPRRRRLAMELTMGLDGPLTFTSLDGRGICQLGFGVLLEVGQVLEVEEGWWGDRRLRGGRVRVGERGLEPAPRG